MSGDHNQYQADQFPDATKMIDCATCGYPLTEDERTGLIEINGKMHKPWADLTADDYDELEARYGDVPDLVLLDIIWDVTKMLKEKNR